MNVSSSPVSPASARPRASRHDVYGLIHKGLRSFMLETLTRLGGVDCGAPAETAAALGQVAALLEQLKGHLMHEEVFLHTALEERRPGSSAATALEHGDHHKAFGELGGQLDRCKSAHAQGLSQELSAGLKELYLSLSFFVAENLAHMYREETETTNLLWQLYSDDELRQIEGAIVASESPEELGAGMRWMLPAITPQERTALLGGAQRGLPPQAFAGLMGLAESALDPEQYQRLRDELNLS